MKRRSLALSVSVVAVGGAAGWFLCDLLANPLVYLALPDRKPLALVAAALAGALIGFLLPPRPEAEEWEPRRPTSAQIAVTVLAAGLLLGLAGAGGRSPEELGVGALVGLGGAVPFVPVAALVI